MKQATVTIDGQNYTVDVKEPSAIEKMHIAAQAPDELAEAGERYEESQDLEDAQVDFTPAVVDYLVDTATRVTELSEEDLNALDAETTVRICAEIINVLFEDDSGTRSNNRCVKRVRVTREFITHLFRGEMTMVAGLPDDAVFEEFHYDPARMELQFVFSSNEWEPVDEGAEIPVAQATCVEIPSSTKQL